VRYSLERDAVVDVRVFDVLGRLVAVLDHGERPAGAHDVAWDGRNMRGQDAATGMYFVRLAAGSRTFERKVVIVR
jgi:flagellar hook assembly protein FlgD